MPFMTHPDLPGQEITVSDLGVAIRSRAGWQVTTDPPKKKAPKPLRRKAEPAVEAEPAPSDQTAPSTEPAAESGDTTKE